ncbi:hypothetical protein [Pseudoxanthomonas sp. CF125]|jgi:hypothetical protein|uniref:hypothetical protein n=1 Tax=Pseudoxanthomonas sp. CF125 TaxID=1855303 RepID=UPI0008833F6D|nr:hypothetical protein [Pseudoxanthomonas sp. CF125]SDQ88736.1 hypothetical protein SAMN05216569_2439 [Pseudoxanthomonas sp. CF125]
MNHKIMPLTLLVALALAGCNGDKPAPPAAGHETAPASAPLTRERKVPESLSDPSHALTLRPGAIDRCTATDGFIAVEVSWDATGAKTEGVHVFLQNVGEERRLWSSAGAIGKDTTGKWMHEGATVILVNASNDQELARVQLKDVPCD